MSQDAEAGEPTSKYSCDAVRNRDVEFRQRCFAEAHREDACAKDGYGEDASGAHFFKLVSRKRLAFTGLLCCPLVIPVLVRTPAAISPTLQNGIDRNCYRDHHHTDQHGINAVGFPATFML